MRLFIMILVSAIIVITIYLLIHRTMINRATLMLRKQAQAATDAAMAYALKQNLLQLPSMPESQLVADVWGKGVLAFEYTLKAKKVTELKVTELKEKDVEMALNTYAKEKHLDHLPTAAKTFVVTDWWTYEQMLHIDVAYIYNEATREYVMDLRKLNQNN